MFNLKKIVAAFTIFFASSGLVFGYVSESSNYRMEKDSFNFGGTENSTSSNYSLSDTLGEFASGDSSGILYAVKAGYRAAAGDYTITISAPENISLAGLTTTGGQSDGSGSWTVTTNDPSGYLLYISAGAAPALQSSGDSFADYTPASVNVPDFVWSVDSTDSEFGFTVSGSDVAAAFKNNGSACNVGSEITADRCWYNLSTSDYLIASNNDANNPAGTVTTVKFKAEIGSGKTQTAGSYSADITLTALSQ
ncbi:MAG TPA: hypothetical protein PKN73_00070 [Candidatus Paceibacterota bacterium]|jgi:hypothetical protein|nr:hypothetical protein [Candidatus Paceibacterota bacterium]HOH11159.1 hypothetical protein [Candidatus Paceibacterota bacterium]HPB60251.1 hypothetical protein [Candidatus Paceibacterota bacterium]HPV33485.1 hypothetical protein [Candidatus Paceibacterota bacterium]HPY12846.1 hypothetical protein [Candidatus Paceibacterota bacterium]